MMAKAPGSALRPTKTAILLARQLVEQILREDLPPGTRLPSEREMLEQYEVGRGTLREALRYLELQGVLSIRQGPRGGPVVSAPDGQNLASVLGLLLAMSRTPFRQVVDVRLLLEPPIAARAAREVTSGELDHLRRLTAAMADPRVNEVEFLELNQEFHEVVAAAARNDVFAYFITSLHWISDGAVVGISYSRGRRAAIVEAHERILDALARRDEAAAERAMQRHLEEWRLLVERHHRRALDQAITW